MKLYLFRGAYHEEQAYTIRHYNSKRCCVGIVGSGSDLDSIPAMSCSSCIVDKDFWRVKMDTKWKGLWALDKQGLYAGQVIKKKDIPSYTRIVLRYNKFYEKDGNRPRFVYCFSDSEEYKEKCVPVDKKPYKDGETYYTEDGNRLYTRDEVRAVINGTVDAVEYGIHDPYDILPEDFV